jgi:hypothetical protein
MTLLLLQESIGPRCFIPAFLDYFPEHKTWDYFPKTLPLDLESGGTEQLSCVICMEAIHLPGEKEQEPDEDAEEGERDGLLEKGRRASMADIGRSITGRWSYMVRRALRVVIADECAKVPPCHHIMHTQCLESWLAIKSEWCVASSLPSRASRSCGAVRPAAGHCRCRSICIAELSHHATPSLPSESGPLQRIAIREACFGPFSLYSRMAQVCQSRSWSHCWLWYALHNRLTVPFVMSHLAPYSRLFLSSLGMHSHTCSAIQYEQS